MPGRIKGFFDRLRAAFNVKPDVHQPEQTKPAAKTSAIQKGVAAIKKAVQTVVQKIKDKSKKRKKKRKKKKPSDKPLPPAPTVLMTIREMIATWSPLPGWYGSLPDVKRQHRGTLENVLNGAIATYGEEAVAAKLEKSAERAISLASRALYDSDSTRSMNSLTAFATLLRGQAMTPEESIEWTDGTEVDSVDQWSDFNGEFPF